MFHWQSSRRFHPFVPLFILLFRVGTDNKCGMAAGKKIRRGSRCGVNRRFTFTFAHKLVFLQYFLNSRGGDAVGDDCDRTIVGAFGTKTVIKEEALNTKEATSHRVAHCHYSDEELSSRPSPKSPWARLLHYYDNSGAWLHRKCVSSNHKESLLRESFVTSQPASRLSSQSRYAQLVVEHQLI